MPLDLSVYMYIILKFISAKNDHTYKGIMLVCVFSDEKTCWHVTKKKAGWLSGMEKNLVVDERMLRILRILVWLP